MAIQEALLKGIVQLLMHALEYRRANFLFQLLLYVNGDIQCTMTLFLRHCNISRILTRFFGRVNYGSSQNSYVLRLYSKESGEELHQDFWEGC